MKGRFHFILPDKRKFIVPNIVTDQGEESFLKMILRADVAEVAAGGNFFIGLCSEIPAEADTLADITTELTAAGGYARKAVTRDITGWPTIVDSLTGGFRGLSQQVDFTATGADFSGTFNRAFLCNVVSGTVGRLFAYSGAVPDPIAVLNGQTHSMKYELFAR